DAEDEAPDQLPHSYVPIDPCQPVIMAIRAGVGEHIRREYIDLETDEFLPSAATMPDPYALRHVSLQRFAAALLTMIPPPSDLQTRRRVLHMAARLVQLEHDLAAAKPGDDPPKILFVCSVLHWPWVRHAYNQLKQQADVVNGPAQHDSSTSMVRLDKTTRPEQQGGRDASGRRVFPLPLPDDVQPPRSFPVNDRTLMFLFGELPSITGLFERARAELEDDENLSVDGVKELLVTARDAYYEDLGRRARRVTPLLLSQCLKYIRNLSLISGRMTPDLVTIVTASQQILGDQFAIHVVEQANSYPYANGFDQETIGDTLKDDPLLGQAQLGIDQARLPNGDIIPL
ncbi:MAG: hypothetical protein AAFN70_21145, partial [Planctomycetota bacterium]